jgi:glyceraldehyde-3-phosphate dehydrogenase/erythrose-4-phosphate dehydrogenase
MPLIPTYDSEITFQSDRIKSAVEFIKIVSDLWYDNEFGYSHQVIRLAKYIAKVRRFTYY